MADDIANAAKAAMDAAAANAQTSDKKDPQILVGLKTSYQTGTGMTQSQDSRPLSKMKEDILASATLNPTGYMTFAKFMYDKGFLGKSAKAIYNPTKVAGSLDYVSDLYLAYQKNAGANPKPFFSWLETYAPPGGGVNALGGPGAYRGPVTSSNISLTDPETAKSVVNDAAVQQLGRNLTAKEQAKYAAEFNQMERKSPTVTTTTPSGHNSTSVTRQGMAKDEMLRQIMAENPDFAKYQIDSGVMDWFVNTIKKGQAIVNG